MGKNDFSRTLTGSDSGYGDDVTVVSDRNSASSTSLHPLSRKGYEIGPAAKLQIGDVFEFLWADCPEFDWEWKCLGYTRFIVLRHSDSFPHYCACVPISTGNRRDFAKPGIDALQQGYVYASGDNKDRDHNGTGTDAQRQSKNMPELAYSSVGISLKSGRHRVKDDSRANYADIVEVDHEAQVMVIGDAVRYFDRVRKNVNKAYMRQVLREALGPYCQRKKSESAAAGVRGWGNSAVSLTKEVPVIEDKEQEQAQAQAQEQAPDGEQCEEDETPEERAPEQAALEQPRPEHVRAEPLSPEQTRPEQTRPEQTRPEHTTRTHPERPRLERTRTEHTQQPERPRPERTRTEHIRREHTRADHRRPDFVRPEYVRLPETPVATTTTTTDKDLEDFFSDSTTTREDWEGGSPRSPAYFHPHPSPPQSSSSDERRARRAASRARASTEQQQQQQQHTTGVRHGMDKAGLSSLRTLRQGLPGGGDDHEDAQSLRSLAMVGRSDSYSSSRRGH